MEFMSYDRLRTDGTFKLNAATKGAIASNPDDILGKAVTFVTEGDGTEPCVGYGTGTEMVAGIVTAYSFLDEQQKDIVVTVSWEGTFIDLDTPKMSTTAKIGAGIAAGESGAVVTSADNVNAICMAVNKEKTKCMIKFN